MRRAITASMGTVIGDFLCLCVSMLQRKNDSGCLHQNWYTYDRTSVRTDLEVQRWKVKVTGYEVCYCHWRRMHLMLRAPN